MKAKRVSAIREDNFFLARGIDLGIFLLFGPFPIFHSTDLYRFYVIFVCFVALSPKSTAMVMAGRSFHLTTLFPWQA